MFEGLAERQTLLRLGGFRLEVEALGEAQLLFDLVHGDAAETQPDRGDD